MPTIGFIKEGERDNLKYTRLQLAKRRMGKIYDVNLVSVKHMTPAPVRIIFGIQRSRREKY